jgi:hypothetical protein
MAIEPAASRLMESWDPAGGGTAHRRLAALLAELDRSAEPFTVPAGATVDDTLGERNRRLLALHRDLVGSPLEARVTCGRCGVDSEFEVPVDAILELPGPEPDAQIAIRVGRRRLVFRLPRMADLEAAGEAASPAEVRRQVVGHCRVDGGGGTIPELVAHRLAARFEALDPAANIVVNVACSGCGAPLAASVDVAGFVARGIDRLVEGLLREVDTIAAAYGWDEARILALPAWRRRHYVELIAAARAGTRAPLRTAIGAGPR